MQRSRLLTVYKTKLLADGDTAPLAAILDKSQRALRLANDHERATYRALQGARVFLAGTFATIEASGQTGLIGAILRPKSRRAFPLISKDRFATPDVGISPSPESPNPPSLQCLAIDCAGQFLESAHAT